MQVQKIFIMMILILLASTIFQCDKKPVEKLQIAEMLIKRMEITESLKYAPEKYDMSMNHFNKAKSYISQKDYKKADIQLDYCINVSQAALAQTKNKKEIEEINQKNQENSEIVYSDTTNSDNSIKNEELTEKNIEQSDVIAEETVHVVESGDCLSKISVKYYQNSKYWKKIYNANNEILDNPDFIIPGQRLTIPAIQTSQQIQLNDNEYLVEKGETLWEISEKIYTNASINHWNLIYNLNKDKINNPNLVKSGIVINIPDLNDFGYTVGDTSYLVKVGDNIWKIAQMLNDADSTKFYTWQNIFSLNMSELADSNSIYPDQIIKLPK